MTKSLPAISSMKRSLIKLIIRGLILTVLQFILFSIVLVYHNGTKFSGDTIVLWFTGPLLYISIISTAIMEIRVVLATRSVRTVSKNEKKEVSK